MSRPASTRASNAFEPLGALQRREHRGTIDVLVELHLTEGVVQSIPARLLHTEGGAFVLHHAV
eukprot:569475-Pelagomonas_calceolata.AAC.6